VTTKRVPTVLATAAALTGSQDRNGASTDAIVQSAARLTNGQIILMQPRTGRAVAST
jgi:hypothetical protein